MKSDYSTRNFLKIVAKAIGIGGLVIAIGYPFVGEPAEWVGLIVFAGLMGD